MLVERRRAELLHPLKLALLRAASDEAAKLIAAGEYGDALPLAQEAVRQGQAVFKQGPNLQLFPLYLLAAQVGRPAAAGPTPRAARAASSDAACLTHPQTPHPGSPRLKPPTPAPPRPPLWRRQTWGSSACGSARTSWAWPAGCCSRSRRLPTTDCAASWRACSDSCTRCRSAAPAAPVRSPPAVRPSAVRSPTPAPCPQNHHGEALRSFSEDAYHCAMEFGPEDMRTSVCYFNLGKVFQAQGERVNALACNRKARRV